MQSKKESLKTYALIGAAGYVAPRHMRAIKAIGGHIIAALDPKDSVGIIDSFFPDAEFFVEFERFDRHIDKLRRRGKRIEYVSICSPNYLHDAHCRFALRSDADAICEKPLVLNPWNIDGLSELEVQTGRKVSTILQLRLHPAVRALKAKVHAAPLDEFEVELTYVVPRGRWYHVSWKGDVTKSGGIATNIGVHFFDLMAYVFGPVTSNVVHLREHERAAGFLVCKHARIRWFLSIDQEDLPSTIPANRTSYRSIIINGEELELSDNFVDLHTRSYEHIVNEGGFGLQTVRPGIEIVSSFRTLPVNPRKGERHPLASRR